MITLVSGHPVCVPCSTSLRGCLISFQQVIFILGNGEHTEHTKNNQIQSPPLTRGGLGWGETIFDTLIITY